jgi:penicillin-binding protein 2
MLVFDQLNKNDTQLRVLTVLVLGGMGVLLAGLWFIQVIASKHFSENQKAQAFRTVRIPAVRGKIQDRNGVALAENRPSYNVSIYLDELRGEFKGEWLRTKPNGKLNRAQRGALEAEARYRVVSNLVSQLGGILQQPVALDHDQFISHYNDQLALPLPVLNNLNALQIARIQEQPKNPAGVDLDIQPIRIYPYGTTAAHLIGVLMRDDSSAVDEDAFFNFRLPDYKGVIGIEGGFDQKLRGRAGVKNVLVNSLGYRQSENVWEASEPGNNVVLTIDLEIQRAAERALREAHTRHPQTCGAAVVMDCRSGDILAMVSSPAFDPSIYIPKLTYEGAEAAKLNDKVLTPQKNRATQMNYLPGSIFKIVDALAALEAGLDPKEKIYNPPDPAEPWHGHIMVGRRKVKDTAKPGEYDFRRALINSCNTYFITNGIRYGVEGIVRIGQRLHFGERTGLPTRQEIKGSFPTLRGIHSGWFDGDTANLCIGQGAIDVTPVQIAVMISAVANGGTVLWPRLVDRIEPQDPTSGESPIRFPGGQARDNLGVKPRTLEIVHEAMLADVEDKEEGTGKLAAVDGLRICAKTGTAQVKDVHGNLTDYTTWFASFAPYEKPRYVVVVMVESGSSGGGTCAPIAKKIYTAIQTRELTRKSQTLARSE